MVLYWSNGLGKAYIVGHLKLIVGPSMQRIDGITIAILMLGGKRFQSSLQD
jgi:hypothetical protein